MSDNNHPKRLERAEEKHYSDNEAPQIKYDVFINFRGEIRRGFLSHLVGAFKRKQINAFVDNILQKGHKIGPSLDKAIEGSSILLIIFSKDYASSHWCLDELVKIHECEEKYGRIVIPVFYDVEPTHVRNQSSETYIKAFDEYEKKGETKVKSWRDAMKKSAHLCGLEASAFEDEEKLVEEIVNLIHGELKKLATPVNSKKLVAIDQKVAAVESLIKNKSKKTLVIGIWGMGGIGKTTLAEEVFNKLQCEYEGSKLVLNERQLSGNGRIISLRNEIFSGLLGNDVKIDRCNSLPGDIARRISRMKVLIVLDDVNNYSHLENLLGDLGNFGLGSTIIVTTRDKQVLEPIHALRAHVEIYQLSELSSDEALELFNLNAFNQMDHQKEEYHELSKRMVHYAKGSPLVVTVLARGLHGKDKEIWESQLDKLKKTPPKEVYDVMKLSYDDLDLKEQQTFLDLACFFLKLHRMVKVDHLKSLLKDEGDHSVAVTLERLKDKALVTLSEDNFISMHDSLQEMGLEIVQREDPRRHLRNPEDFCEALKNDKGTKAIRSIQIDLMKIKEQKLSPDIFTNMSRLEELKFLEVYNGSYQHNILAEGLHLRFLSLYSYPQASLPENISTEKLVILKLRASRIKKLWDGVKNLVNLKELDLSQSLKLKELPDLSKATNLEVLRLWGCSELAEVHPSIFSLPKLEKLDLWKCKSLGKLASDSHLQSLTYLNVLGCERLQELSVISENMRDLRFECHIAERHPSSFGHQSNLESLHLDKCDIKLLTLPFKGFKQLLNLKLSLDGLKTIVDLPPALKTLDVYCCASLQNLPELPKSLETLNVRECTSLETLPKLSPSLKTLEARDCKSLRTLGELSQSLETLNVRECTSLETLPELPQSLETLNVSQCTSLKTLPELPQSLQTLNVSQCTSLETLRKLSPSLKTLEASYCESLRTLGELPQSLETLNVNWCTSLKTLQELPQSLETLHAPFCSSLQTLPELPMFLKTLNVDDCTSLETLPELPQSLETLNVSHCTSLKTLPELPDSIKTLIANLCIFQALPELPLCLKNLHVYRSSLKSLPELPLFLKTLHASLCSSLQTLPELPMFLKTLNVEDCTSLETLPELPQSLKTLNVSQCTSLETLPELPDSIKTLHAGDCILQVLPELPLYLKNLHVDGSSLKNLPELPLFLETLHASSCSSLQTLPELPMFLETVVVRECTSLETLPKLPLFIKYLDASNCKSLKTVEEFRANMTQQLLFWNCLRLDVRNNMMIYANQFLSTANCGHFCRAVYAYPGSSVPEWLEYKTKKEYIIIDLSSAPRYPLLGFIFCFVLRKDLIALDVDISIFDSEGERIRVDVISHREILNYKIESDHVYVLYDQRCSTFLNIKARNQTRFEITVNTPAQLILKGFGVSPISPQHIRDSLNKRNCLTQCSTFIK